MQTKTNDAIGKFLSMDILNANGHLVLPQGVEITPALAIALLKQGIKSIDVDVLSEEESVVNESDAAKVFHEHVNYLFIRHRGPFMKEFQTWLLKE
ncbi:hypothetical protein [Reinekea sp. G2M2-21]|uniref:hypothetical protein n=1 Tax=Reinekea sp. G2M2-21 TaxID=2788942 RepID=UPI0018ABC5AC|nr:hypothetical protein [Reinekea sp. G2M2-21]